MVALPHYKTMGVQIDTMGVQIDTMGVDTHIKNKTKTKTKQNKDLHHAREIILEQALLLCMIP